MRRIFDEKMWLGGAMLAMLAGGCGAPPEAKSKPTWVDVYPILAGRCLHCHGAAAEEAGEKYRLDFRDPQETCGEDLAMRAGVTSSFVSIIKASATDIPEGASRPKMPPQTSPALEDWEIETLKNWESNGRAPGTMPKGNGKPTVTVTRARKSGGNVEITYLIEDPDGDPVLGEITVGDAAFPVKSAGGGTIKVPTTDTSLTLTAELCDGWKAHAPVDVKVTVK